MSRENRVTRKAARLHIGAAEYDEMTKNMTGVREITVIEIDNLIPRKVGGGRRASSGQIAEKINVITTGRSTKDIHESSVQVLSKNGVESDERIDKQYSFTTLTTVDETIQKGNQRIESRKRLRTNLSPTLLAEMVSGMPSANDEV